MTSASGTAPEYDLKYFPAVDGLRCIAVAAVLLFHYRVMDFGWAGVWLFFSISGFVITRSLDDLCKDRLKFRDYLKVFYIRRIFRILPLYLAFVAAGAVVVWFFMSGHLLALWLPYLLTFTVNFFRILPNYEDAFFSHMWSLSVEEQFYLLYPILLFFIGSRKARNALLFSAICLSPLLRAAIAIFSQAPFDGQIVYFLSFVNFDAFAIGGLVALNRDRIFHYELAAKTAPLFAAVLLLLGTGLFAASASGDGVTLRNIAVQIHRSIVVGAYGYGREAITYAALNLASFSLLVIATGASAGSKLLSHSFIAYFGRISYGIYVLHFPLILLLRHLVPEMQTSPILGAVLFLPYLVTVLVLAALSDRWFEQKWRRVGTRLSRKLVADFRPKAPDAAPQLSEELSTLKL